MSTQFANRSRIVEPGGQLYAEQAIEFVRTFDNSTFVHNGTYNATNGSSINFFDFTDMLL